MLMTSSNCSTSAAIKRIIYDLAKKDFTSLNINWQGKKHVSLTLAFSAIENAVLSNDVVSEQGVHSFIYKKRKTKN